MQCFSKRNGNVLVCQFWCKNNFLLNCTDWRCILKYRFLTFYPSIHLFSISRILKLQHVLGSLLNALLTVTLLQTLPVTNETDDFHV